MILLLLSTVIMLEAVEPKKSPPVDEFQAIRERGEIVAGIVQGMSAPFLLKGKDGKPDGFSVRVAQHIASQLEVKLKLDTKSANFENLIDRLARGELDIGLGGLTPTGERALRVRFSEPIITGSLTALMNRLEGLSYRGCPTLAQLAELARTKGGLGMVENGATIQRFENAIPNAKIEKKPNHLALRNAVLKGDIVAAAGSEVITRYFLQEHGGDRLLLELCPYPELSSPVAIGVRPDAPDLQDWLNAVLADSGIHYTAQEVVQSADDWEFGWTDVLRGQVSNSPSSR